ncbi:MAG: septal ring lytic transglycosylase RlpA family protein [Treponema sp.]|nr:septal ring lytic transglycosylase RlpA family protein [Treponema sp.]
MNKKKILALFCLFTTSITLWAQNSKQTSQKTSKLTVYKTNVVASYYADAFHGKLTSSGETFNMNDYTCAHKELPFGTILRVTNLKNGLTVDVRVNDRGPFVVGREIDLSCAAANTLKMTGDGTVKVKLEIVKLTEHSKQSKVTAEKAMEKMAKLEEKTQNQNTTTTVANTSTQNRAPGKIWDIQLGAFSSRENANKLAQSLLRAGFTNVVFQKSEGIFRVVIRQVATEDLAAMEKRLKEKGFKEYTIRERKIK